MTQTCNPSSWVAGVGYGQFQASLGCIARPCLKKTALSVSKASFLSPPQAAHAQSSLSQETGGLFSICPDQKPSHVTLSPHTIYQQILHLQHGTATLFWPGASSRQLPSGFYSQPVSAYPTCFSSGKLLGTVSSLSQFRTWFSSELSRSLPFPSSLRDSVWSALFYSSAQTSELVCCIPHSGMLLHQISALSTSIFSETFPGLTPLSPSPTKALSVHTLKGTPPSHHQALVLLILCPCVQSSSYHQQASHRYY